MTTKTYKLSVGDMVVNKRRSRDLNNYVSPILKITEKRYLLEIQEVGRPETRHQAWVLKSKCRPTATPWNG